MPVPTRRDSARRLPVRRLAGLAAVPTAALAVAACGGGAAVPRIATGPIPATRALPITAAAAGWPMLLHNPSHYGAATVAGPQTARVRWRRRLEGAVVPGPVIARGEAYVASNAGVLHAVSVSTGRDRWRFDGGGSYGSDLSTAPLVRDDGVVLWPGPRHRLFALGSDGRLRWTLQGQAYLLTPVLDPVGSVLVVADQSGEISGYRLASDRRRPVRLWSRQLASPSYGNPAVAADGTIYETAGDALFALTPAGHLLWTVHTPAPIEVSPAIADHGIVVFGSNDRHEYGVDATGHVRWRVPIGNFTYSSPLALPGHRVIFGNHSGQMTVLDSDSGRRRSRDQVQGLLWTSAAVDGRGDVYFASRRGRIFGFDAAGRHLFDLNAGSTFDGYPALASDGTLLVGSDDGTLYALR